jgi:hypothetical protein
MPRATTTEPTPGVDGIDLDRTQAWRAIAQNNDGEDSGMTSDRTTSLGRREFLGALGAGASAAAAGALAAPAQAAAEKPEAKPTAALKIIDFHNHYVRPNFALTTLAGCGLDAAEQQMVASGNTLKLLGVS